MAGALQVSASGPWAVMQLCRLAPPRQKAFTHAAPCSRPMNSVMTLRWYRRPERVLANEPAALAEDDEVDGGDYRARRAR